MARYNYQESVTLELRVLSLREAERAAILEALKWCEGHAEGAARVLKIGKSTMFRKIKDHKITDKERYA